MQIEVVDDYSTKDDPESVVRELGKGRVQFYRQSQNVGSTANFNTCIQRSRGRLVHILHGDDCVRRGFYQKMQVPFDKEPLIGAAFCRHVVIDENDHWEYVGPLEEPKSGILNDWLCRIAVLNRLQPPSIVVKREVYEKVGAFDSRISCCGEDWEMWIRIAARYSVWYEPEPLALYRVHSTNLTGRCAKSGQNLRDMREIIKISQSYIPPSLAKNLSRQAREHCAIYAASCILPPMIKDFDWRASTTQTIETLKTSSSISVLKVLINVFLKIFVDLTKTLVKSSWVYSYYKADKK